MSDDIKQSSECPLLNKNRQRRQNKYMKTRYGNSLLDIELQNEILTLDICNYAVRNIGVDKEYKIVITVSPYKSLANCNETIEQSEIVEYVLRKLKYLNCICKPDLEDVIISLDMSPWTRQGCREHREFKQSK
ncbi:MAG: hypothetical protein Sylvanvirus9_2 [Sylvanvirus sp.]|uniref:Uncharacterized protein n=1 Tax=Sylvanvirus sp. TaxID=2487774 RepID=A0A3G5AHT1_9VIRU|nr:MAG: hypothetical protein Sylvanvirus9_2 [Sylvanvirus sp.]